MEDKKNAEGSVISLYAITTYFIFYQCFRKAAIIHEGFKVKSWAKKISQEIPEYIRESTSSVNRQKYLRAKFTAICKSIQNDDPYKLHGLNSRTFFPLIKYAGLKDHEKLNEAFKTSVSPPNFAIKRLKGKITEINFWGTETLFSNEEDTAGSTRVTEPEFADQKKKGDVINFDNYINYKCKDFTGRDWLFEKIQSFIYPDKKEEFYLSGYLLLKGDPGIGKTTVMARLVQKYNYVHFFNIQSEGINTTSLFLKHICIQLIEKFALDKSLLTTGYSDHISVLNTLLKSISDLLSKRNEKCVIVVDAIDEATSKSSSPYLPVFLPELLPENVLFILSTRTEENFRMPFNNRFETISIEGMSAENQADANSFLQYILKRNSVKSYLKLNNITKELFIETLLDKSEGNFMYLFHIIREISFGFYASSTLEELPKGLEQYYESHWHILKSQDTYTWDNCFLPVLAVLAIADAPISISMIRYLTGIKKTAQIADALSKWDAFLHKTQNGYTLYHKSFKDFLYKKEQVKGEAFDLDLTRQNYLNKLEMILNQ